MITDDKHDNFICWKQGIEATLFGLNPRNMQFDHSALIGFAMKSLRIIAVIE